VPESNHDEQREHYQLHGDHDVVGAGGRERQNSSHVINMTTRTPARHRNGMLPMRGALASRPCTFGVRAQQRRPIARRQPIRYVNPSPTSDLK
jgi:hypothetical protein